MLTFSVNNRRNGPVETLLKPARGSFSNILSFQKQIYLCFLINKPKQKAGGVRKQRKKDGQRLQQKDQGW